MRLSLDRLSAVAVLATCGIVAYSAYRARGESIPAPVPIPSEPVSIVGAPTIGLSSANAAMVIFSDFQCPFCSQFAKETWPTLRTRYVDGEKLVVAFRNLPLEQIHSRAVPAASAALCAERVGRQFWAMHDLLFSAPNKLDDDALGGYADKLGLNRSEFQRCMSTDAVPAVEKDAEDARAIGLKATPTFLFGRRSGDGSIKVSQALRGAQPLDAFVAAIESVLR